MTTETTASQLPTAPSQPVEFRLGRAAERVKRGHEWVQEPRPPYVLTCWPDADGRVRHSLTVAGHGTQQALSCLQSPCVWPGLAVPGWQADVLAFVDAGLFPVVQIRSL